MRRWKALAQMFLLLSLSFYCWTVSCGMEYPLGQFGSAVLAMPPPSFWNTIPTLWGEQSKEKKAWCCASTSHQCAKHRCFQQCYQHWFNHKFKIQYYTGIYEENYPSKAQYLRKAVFIQNNGFLVPFKNY